MYARQPAFAGAFGPAPRRARGQARAVAIGVSIGAHLLIGAYVLTAVVQPLKIKDLPDGPVITGPIVTLPEPPIPRPTIPPHSSRVRASRGPADPTTPLLPATPQTPLTLDQPKTVVLADAGPAAPPAKIVRHTITDPAWLTRPSADQLGRAYPERAARLGLSGAAVLDCTVLASGAIGACEVVSETPRDQGFAKAALGLSHLFRMKPRTEDGEAVDGGVIRIPVRFAIDAG